MENLVTRATQILDRPDGSQARIVSTAMFGAGLQRSIDFYVHRRPNAEADWELCSNQPHPEWRTMSVAEYIERGRSPMLRTVSIGEILKVTSLVGTTLDPASATPESA